MIKSGKVLLLLLFTIVLFLFLFSCNESSEKPDQTNTIFLKFDPNTLPSPSPLSEIVEKIRLIPLETNPECLISDVIRAFIGEKYILAVSNGNRQYLFLFTLEGKFIRKIGHQGKGPGEYINISYISVFEDMEQVYISTGVKGDMLVFNFNGDFIRKIKGIQGSFASKRVGPDQTAYTTYLDYEIKIVNEKKEDTLSLFPVDPENIVYHTSYLYGSENGGFFYALSGKDVIWKVEKDSLVPAIVCDFGSGSLSPKELINYALTGRLPAGKLVIDGFPFYGAGYYHFLLLQEDKKGEEKAFDILVDEESHQSWFIKSSPESDDILFSDAYFFKNSANTGEMISVAYAIDLINGLPKIKENKSFSYDSKTIKQIEQLSEEDNPVLVLFTLK